MSRVTTQKSTYIQQSCTQLILLISIDEKSPIWYYFAANQTETPIISSANSSKFNETPIQKAAPMAWEQRSSCLLLMMPRQSQALKAAFFV